jgi:glycine/D-amino acid oxidase-like deaminating enzyme
MMLKDDDLFLPGARAEPYWWDAARPELASDTALPRMVDVVVVGSGITGLNAAIVLAREGRSTLVLEAESLGHGASSRNAGFLGRVIKHSFGKLMKRHGVGRAVAVYGALAEAFKTVFEVVESEGIECGIKRCGRLMVAPSPGHLADIEAEYALRKQWLKQDFGLLQKHELADEIQTDRYAGGVVIPDLGALHPGLYTKGLLAAARRAGAIVIGNTPVAGITRTGTPARFEVQTQRGLVTARDVLIATNGYTGPAIPWFQRRAIPFDAYMIATEPLSDNLAKALLPTDRTYLDSNHNIDFFRRMPDGRILFGGRTGSGPPSLAAMARTLRKRLQTSLPGIGEPRLSHVWTGKCAGTFDLYPHVGQHEGMHYAMGYCFAGVPMGTWLGRKCAMKILGRAADGRTPFDARPFPTIPFYSGNPWFVRHVMAGYDWLDRRHARH